VTSDTSPQMMQTAPPVTDEEINSEVALLETEDLLREVVVATGLANASKDAILAHLLPDESADKRTAQAVRQLAKHLDVETVKNTDVINVSYKTTDPQLGYSVLSTLANSYMEKHLAVHRPPGAFDFFQKETEQYRNNLEASEARLAEFEGKNQLESADVQGDLTQKKLSDFDGDLHESQTEISETKHRIGDLESQLNSTPARVSTGQDISDNSQLLQLLGGTLATLELSRNQMAAHYQPDYRPLKDLEAQIARAQEQIEAAKSAQVRKDTTDVNPTYLWLTEELTKSRADLATFEAKAAATDNNVELYRKRSVQLGHQQLEQEDLIRNAKADERNFLLYINKREEARISDALDSKRILNVAIAEPPSVPALPENSRGRSMFIAMALAIIVGLSAAFVSDYMDPTLRTADEKAKVLEIPILAAMPKVQRGRSSAA
jgi:polysaccharide biosynthesis protein PslE